jgi:predicted outer membrane lipoprotein
MLATHRHDRLPPLGWTSSANLFSLIFALLLALAFVVLLLLFFEVMQRDKRPIDAPSKPVHAQMFTVR